jgi:hypothetical protein
MELKNFFATDSQGNVISGATCYLYNRGTTILVTDLQDAEGDPLDNPFVTNSDGLAQFAAQNGEYDLYITSTIRQYTIPVKCIDFEEQVISVETSASSAAESAAEAADSASQAALSASDASGYASAAEASAIAAGASESAAEASAIAAGASESAAEASAIAAGASESAAEVAKTDAEVARDVAVDAAWIGTVPISAIAETALAAGDFVDLYNSGSVIAARKASASLMFPADGFVKQSFTIGQTAIVYPLGGRNEFMTGLIPGQNYFLSTTVDGGIQTSAPTEAGQLYQRIGIAVSATELRTVAEFSVELT